MASLTGQTIASSYEQLLHVDTDGGGNTTTLVPVKDGDNGTTFAMQLSTTTVCIDNPTADSSTQGGILRLQSDDGALMQSGSRLGVIEFAGAEDSSSTITVGGRIESVTDAAWSATENGADMVFYTTDGNASQSEVMRLTADNLVGISESSPEAPLHVKGSSFPVAVFERTVGSGTTGASSSLRLKTTTTGNMADTFGAEIQFSIEDAGATNQPIGAINAVRAGADNTGNLQFISYSTGSQVKNLVLDANSRISLSNNDTGLSNTIFGKDAGDSDGAADLNVFIGELAGGTGTQTDDADSNVGIGYRALTDLTEGTHNVAIGKDSATNMLGGDMNIAIGGDTLYTSTAAIHSIAIGKNAMYSGTASSSTGSIAIGFDSLRNVSSGVGNVAVGYEAGNAIADDNNNTLIGYQSGKVTTGADNTYVGFSAGKGAAGAESNNVGVGSNALLAITTGARNVAVGTNALNDLLTNSVDSSNGNTAIGYNAAAKIQTGASNVAIGTAALDNADGAISNCTIVGTRAGAAIDNTSANGTVAVGKSALTALTSGAGNVAIGYQALQEHTEGSRNLAIGYQAMYNTWDGSADDTRESIDNIGIGYQALGGAWTDSDSDDADYNNYNVGIGNYVMDAAMAGASNNTAVGNSAATSVTTGDDNVCIGSGSGGSITTGNQNTIIGSEANTGAGNNNNLTAIGYDCEAPDVSNAVVLGNADVTAVYMGSDSGARVYCETLNASKAGLCNMNLTSYSTSAGEGATIYLNRSNHGTLGTKAAVDANDVIGQIIFQGSDANTLEAGAYIHVQAAETWDEDSRGTQMTFQCVPSGANSTTITNRLHIAGDGTLTASSSNDISDEELKENIKDVENGLDIIKKLQGRTFTWKESAYMPSGTKYGLIAQELEKILPDLVHDKSGIREKEDGSYYKSIQMSGVIPVLIEAVKELSAKVEALEAK